MAARRLIGAALVGALAALTMAVGAPAAVAAPGDLDPSFGGGDGIATAPGLANALVVDAAAQPGGRILVLTGKADLFVAGGAALVAFTDDGTIDSNFGAGGTMTLPATFAPDGITVLADGTIIVLGSNDPAASLSPGAVVRVLPGGALDAGFGSGGMALVADYGQSPFGQINFTTAISRTGGELTVVGSRVTAAAADSGFGPFAARLDAAGSVQGTSYAQDMFQAQGGYQSAAAETPGGGATVVGTLTSNFSHVAYTRTMAPDGTWSAVTEQDGEGLDLPSSAATLQDGRVVVTSAGHEGLMGIEQSALRFVPAGGGSSTRQVTVTPDAFNDVVVLPDGRVAVAAGALGGTSGSVRVFTGTGSPDTSFSGDGLVEGPAFAGVTTAGGKILAASGGAAGIEVRRYDAGISTSPAEGPIPLVPSRILDTRTGVGYSGPKPGAGSTITLAVAGHGGVPASGAAAVVLNVTATEADGPGFVTVWPAGQPQPNASNVNVDTPGQTIANLVTVPLAADGTVSIFNYGGSHLLADVAAWFPAGGGFVPLTPSRILDTRSGIGYSGPKPAADATVQLSVVGQGGVGPDATAVVLNVTATQADTAGFVTVWPTGQPRPNASNVNIAGAGQTIPNQVYVPVGTGGSVSLYTYGGVHLLADVAGYFTAGGAFHPLTPNRILDTRAAAGPIGYTGSKPAAGAVVSVSVAGAGGVPPSGATAVVMNVTATEADGPGFVTAWPPGAAQPNASNLNLEAAGQTIANLVVVPLGPDGRVNLFTFGGGHLLADVAGWVG